MRKKERERVCERKKESEKEREKARERERKKECVCVDWLMIDGPQEALHIPSSFIFYRKESRRRVVWRRTVSETVA